MESVCRYWSLKGRLCRNVRMNLASASSATSGLICETFPCLFDHFYLPHLRISLGYSSFPPAEGAVALCCCTSSPLFKAFVLLLVFKAHIILEVCTLLLIKCKQKLQVSCAFIKLKTWHCIQLVPAHSLNCLLWIYLGYWRRSKLFKVLFLIMQNWRRLIT